MSWNRVATAVCLSLMTASCGDGTGRFPESVLFALALPDRHSEVLLRPRGASFDGGDLVVIEEGRRTLTRVDLASGELSRRPLWPGHLPSAVTARPDADVGSVLVAASDGFWTLIEGLGPIFVPRDDRYMPTLLGRGVAGQAIDQDIPAAQTDLSEVRGLALDAGGALVLAVEGELWRLDEGRLEPLEVRREGRAVRLGWGSVVGMTFDGAGNAYLVDVDTDRIWRRTPDGQLEAVAGGGPRLASTEPMPASDLLLEPGVDYLAWDDAAGELVVWSGDGLYRVTAPAGSTPIVRALPGNVSRAGGLAVSEGRALVTRLSGVIVESQPDDVRVVWQPPAGTVPPTLGWAGAVEPLTPAVLVVHDAGQRGIAVFASEIGVVPIWVREQTLSPPPGPVGADPSGHVYLVTAQGLRHFDLEAGRVELLARRTAEPFVDGQLVTGVMLPAEGELRAGGDGRLWMLDACNGVILAVDTITGQVSLGAGTTGGGGLPRGDDTVARQLLTLREASSLAVAGELLVLVDQDFDGSSVIYAINASATALGESDDQMATLAGRTVPVDQAVLLGGAGSATFSEGALLGDLDLQQVRRVLPVDGGLVVSAADSAAPTLFTVDAGGAVASVADPPLTAPDALTRLDDDLWVFGWEEEPRLEAFNAGETPRSVFGSPLEPAHRAVVARLDEGVRDLVAIGGDQVLALTVSGTLLAVGPTVSTLGQSASRSRSMAVSDDGAVLLLEHGALWGIDRVGGATFAGTPLPASPGGVIIAPTEGFAADTRLANLAFGPAVTGMAGDGQTLIWTDGEAQALYRAFPTDTAHLEPSSLVELLARGDPVPLTTDPVLLAADGNGGIYVGTYDGQVRVLRDGQWSRFAGSGSEQPAVGRRAYDVDLSGLSGLVVGAAEADEVILRARAGLVRVGNDGTITAVDPSLGTDPADAGHLRLGSSIAPYGPGLALVAGGGVYFRLPGSD